MGQAKWTALSPPFKMKARAGGAYQRAVRSIARTSPDEIPTAVELLVVDAASWPSADRQMLLAAVLVVADLRAQGWDLRVRGGSAEVRPPSEVDSDVLSEKARVRRQELLKRDEQLRHPATARFVHGMERRRLFNGRFVSVFSLMRDGRELASKLRLARTSAREDFTAVDAAIAPYLQFVAPGSPCPHTGLDLHDVWRYFRHTWTNQYTSVPGRSMMFLVRDRAAPLHPVVGIGALASPIVQIRERDEWIGWHPTTFLQEATRTPTAEIGQWLVKVVDDALGELYVEDLVEDQLLERQHLRTPTEETITRLLAEASSARKLHARFVRSRDLKGEQVDVPEAEKWVTRARSHLFRSKRALALAEMLDARVVLQRYLGASPTAEGLTALLSRADGERAVRKIVRRAKAERVGIAMADITVCGAVQPYNAILGGKLVAMMATSPEVVSAYRARYATARSEIASAMAGRPIVREPHLVFLGTTSLYGVGSSQYNRIRIPSAVVGGEIEGEIAYRQLGRSESFGTSQYGDDTLDALGDLVSQTHSGESRVNSIFGEGNSPKLRRVREGLELLRFPTDLLLRHGRQRIVYGVPLVTNLRDFLLGIDPEPAYLLANGGQRSTARIAGWWKRRWLRQRIESDAVLDDVERHTLVHPVSHGARVTQVVDTQREDALSW